MAPLRPVCATTASGEVGRAASSIIRAAACCVLLATAFVTCSPASGAHRLENGEVLAAGQTLSSRNGRFRLELTADGQLVIWELPPGAAASTDGGQAGGNAPDAHPKEHWRSWLYQSALGAPTLQVRRDNKLLIHDTVPWLDQPLLIWESCNVRVAPEGSGALVLGDDGSLAVVAGGGRVWEAGPEESDQPVNGTSRSGTGDGPGPSPASRAGHGGCTAS
jgi:hypothetical protein